MFLDTFCPFTEGYGDGNKKILVGKNLNREDCANQCFQLKRNGNEAVNGATLEDKKCFCELNQTRTWHSKDKMNCHFTKTEGEEGNDYYSFLYILPMFHIIFVFCRTV